MSDYSDDEPIPPSGVGPAGNAPAEAEDDAPAAPNDRRPRNDVDLHRGDHVELGELLVSQIERRGPVVHDEGALYCYGAESGLWAPVPYGEQSRIVQSYAGKKVERDPKPLRIRAGDVGGAIKLGGDRVSQPGFFAEAPAGLAFANGFVSVTAQEIRIMPHAAEHRARAGYSFAFDATLTAERWLSFLADVFRDDNDRAEKIALLQEFAGACVLGIATRYQRAITLLGEGGEGKSATIEVFQAAMPEGTCAAIPPQDWGQEYRRAMLAGIRFNAVSELPEVDIIASEAFKAMITGDKLVGRAIRQAPFNFSPIAGHLFAANRLPGTTDASEGFWRRLVVVRFNRKFTAAEVVPGIARGIIAAELRGIVAWALVGARRLLASGSYTMPPSSVAEVTAWRKNACSVAAFIEAATRDAKDEAEDTGARGLYAAYSAWTKENGFRGFNNRNFAQRMAGLGKRARHSRKGERYPVVILWSASSGPGQW